MIALALAVSAPGAPARSLQAPTSTGALGRPLPELLAAWSRESGAALTAVGDMRDVKLTLHLPRPRNIEGLLPNLARHFSARWRPQKGGQVLEREPAISARRQARARRQRDLEARMRPEQEDAAASALERALMGAPGEQNPLLHVLGSLEPGPRRTLLGGARPMVMAGRTLTPDKTPALSAPFESLTTGQQAAIRRYMADAGWMREPRGATVNLFHAAGAGLWMSLLWPGGARGDAEILHVDPGPSLSRLWSERLSAAEGPPSSAADRAALLTALPGRYRVDWADLDYAEAARALALVVGAPVLADYHTLAARLTLRRDAVTAPELADALAEAFGCRWTWADGILNVRGLAWEERDAREIRQSLLDAWGRERQARHPQCLPLNTLAEVAETIDNEHIGCLRAFSTRTPPHVSLELEAAVVREERDVLRLYHALPPAQRVRLLGPGVSLARLDPRAQPFAADLLRRRTCWALLDSAPVQALRLRPGPPAAAGDLTLALLGPPGELVALPTLLPQPDAGAAPADRPE